MEEEKPTSVEGEAIPSCSVLAHGKNSACDKEVAATGRQTFFALVPQASHEQKMDIFVRIYLYGHIVTRVWNQDP